MIQDTGKNRLSESMRFTEDRSRSGGIAEYYNALIRNLRLHVDGNHLQAIGIASMPGCGQTSVVATNFAICVANAQSSEVVFVNSDPLNRVPQLTFSLEKAPGLFDILRGDATVDEAIQETHLPNLKAVGCGKFDKGSEPYSCLVRFGNIVKQLKSRSGIVVVDLPRADELTPCFDMATSLDGVVLELESSNVKRNVALRTLDQLRFAEAKILGCVFKQT